MVLGVKIWRSNLHGVDFPFISPFSCRFVLWLEPPNRQIGSETKSVDNLLKQRQQQLQSQRSIKDYNRGRPW